MTPVAQPPNMGFQNPFEREQLDALINAALQWREASGWPGKAGDLVLAARLYGQYRGPTVAEEAYATWHAALAHALFEELSRRHRAEEVTHRHLLCLLIIQGVSRGLGFNA